MSELSDALKNVQSLDDVSTELLTQAEAHFLQRVALIIEGSTLTKQQVMEVVSTEFDALQLPEVIVDHMHDPWSLVSQCVS